MPNVIVSAGGGGNASVINLTSAWADLPAAGIPGRICEITDLGINMRDTGSTWKVVGGKNPHTPLFSALYDDGTLASLEVEKAFIDGATPDAADADSFPGTSGVVALPGGFEHTTPTGSGFMWFWYNLSKARSKVLIIAGLNAGETDAFYLNVDTATKSGGAAVPADAYSFLAYYDGSVGLRGDVREWNSGVESTNVSRADMFGCSTSDSVYRHIAMGLYTDSSVQKAWDLTSQGSINVMSDTDATHTSFRSAGFGWFTLAAGVRSWVKNPIIIMAAD